jgi:hypothetical protein
MATPLSKYIRKVTDPVQDALNPIYGAVNKVTEPANQLAGAVGNPLNQATGSIAQSLAGSNLNPMSTAANVSPVQQTPNEYNFLGQTEVELDRNILDKIGGFIGGIKPTLRGQGSTYRSLRAGERETGVNTLNRERMTALAKDARSVNNLLKKSDIEGATNILNSRMSAIQKLGGDPSDTQGIMDMINSGNVKGAISELDLTDSRAIEGGFLKRQTVDREYIGMSDDKTQALFKTRDGVMAIPITGLINSEDSKLKPYREELRVSLRKKRDKTEEQVSSIETNYDKANELILLGKGGNRMAIASALIAVIKLGDDSTVRSDELAVALNTQQTPEALFDFFTGKGVSNDVAKSVVASINPVNPDVVDMDELLAVANALISTRIKPISATYNTSKEDAGFLTKSGYKSIFGGGGLGRRIDALANLNRKNSEPVPANLPEGTADNGNGTFTLPDGRVVQRKQP